MSALDDKGSAYQRVAEMDKRHQADWNKRIYEKDEAATLAAHHCDEARNLAYSLAAELEASRSAIAQQPCEFSGIYVASRVKQAEVWKAYRAKGWKINASWIDEAGEGETADFGELWERIRGEIARSHCLVFYAAGVQDFPFKGALVEVGMALAMGKPVIAAIEDVMIDGRTMRPVGSWLLDRKVIRCDTLEEAMDVAKGVDTLCPPAARSTERERPCTCHPDDSPPKPCQRKFALSECRVAANNSAAVELYGLTNSADWNNACEWNGDISGMRRRLTWLLEMAEQHAKELDGLRQEAAPNAVVASAWVPCSERMPDFEGMVLVAWNKQCNGGTGMETMTTKSLMAMARGPNDEDDDTFVTHWQPLPEAPLSHGKDKT